MNDTEIVSTIRARLAERVGRQRYDVWFGVNARLAVRGDSLEVSVPTQFFKDWLRRHFLKDLEASSLEAVGRPLALEFRIDATTANAEPNGAESNRLDSNSADSNSAEFNGVLPKADAAACVEPPKGSPQSRTNQRAGSARAATHHGSKRRWNCLDSFVVGNSNCLAHKAAQMTAEKPGAYSPLLIHGPTGSGKTHLLEGICTAFRRSHPSAATIYLSAEQFTSHFVEALHGSGLPSFRRKHRGLELLVIDDLQFFANKRATLNELVHTTDELLRSGRQLVFAADRAPAALRTLGSEIVSRLSGGMVCRLEQPEYATRLGIVRQLAIRLGMTVNDEVASFIASHFTSQTRELAGALKRLHAASVAHNKPITQALAEEALVELLDHQGRAVKLADIEKAVCDVCGLDSQSLQSNRKTKTLSHPRMLAMWLARKHTRAPLSEIGTYFGRRSHSTVISAQKKIEGWMSKNAPIRWADRALSLEETIRRVEEQLRAS
ncbi:MAG TPA: chromosomal replication initiator protein DnaA [Pirellulales bacterium]|nr:chromosomal replication initiator protein DnaA [Pirellulales bacterium]